MKQTFSNSSSRLDPPDDEPPSLKKEQDEYHLEDPMAKRKTSGQPEQNADAHGLYSVQPNLQVRTHDHFIVPENGLPDEYVSPESASGHQLFTGTTPASQEPYFQETPRSPEEYFHDTHEQPEYEEYFEETPRSPPNGEYFHEGTNYENSEMPTSPYTPTSQMDREFYDSDEKKSGIEREDVDSQLENSADFGKEMKEEEENVMDPDGHAAVEKHFVDTTYVMPDEYGNISHPGPFSPGEASANSGMDSLTSHQSPALRGAHEILKRRRRRLEM
jgi:hypothetical protein